MPARARSRSASAAPGRGSRTSSFTQNREALHVHSDRARGARVVGTDGAIGGFTAMNDWSARDLQRQEMAIGLGPAKGKDFATSLGPVVVSPDELGDLRLEMVARVNGEERSRGNLGDMYWSWEAVLAHAARNTELRPGDVIGSGTVGTGCILEHGDERWLRPGDEVELEVEGIGILRNRIR